MTDEEMLAVLRDAGVLEGLRRTTLLLAQGRAEDVAHGPRWHRLDDYELAAHAVSHARHVRGCIDIVDHDSGHPEACHVAARGLMLATRAGK